METLLYYAADYSSPLTLHPPKGLRFRESTQNIMLKMLVLVLRVLILKVLVNQDKSAMSKPLQE